MRPAYNTATTTTTATTSMTTNNLNDDKQLEVIASPYPPSREPAFSVELCQS
jgi:hypothetical protein